MTYRELWEKYFNVSLSWRDIDDNECYRIVDMNNGLWTEDEVKIVRSTYEPIKEVDGSECIVRGLQVKSCNGISLTISNFHSIPTYSLRGSQSA